MATNDETDRDSESEITEEKIERIPLVKSEDDERIGGESGREQEEDLSGHQVERLSELAAIRKQTTDNLVTEKRVLAEDKDSEITDEIIKFTFEDDEEIEMEVSRHGIPILNELDATVTEESRKDTKDDLITVNWTYNGADLWIVQIVPKKTVFCYQISGSTYREKKNNLKKHLIEYYIDKFQPPTMSEADKVFVEPSMKVVPNADWNDVFIEHLDTDHTEYTYKSIFDVHIFREDLDTDTEETDTCTEETDTDTEETDTDNSHCVYDMQSKQIKKNSSIQINDVFFDAPKKFYRICISGDAGQGKSAFCKMLCLAWCQAHLSEAYSGYHIPDDFIKVMKKFDILFYIDIRETNPFLISTNLINALYFNDDSFFKLFLKTECDNSSVLVILDGAVKRRASEMTDFRGFTILTTNQHRGPSEFDRVIKLKGIKKEAAYKYVKNIVDILNQKENATKDGDMFIKQMEDKNLKQILNIPIILKQLIILWHHDEVEIMGRSQVYLFSAMINRFLMEVKNSYKNKSLPGEKNKEINLPECLEEKHYCRLYKDILLSLSHHAFKAVCKIHCFFDDAVPIVQNLAEEDINACISAGFLCQEDGRISFLHKSFRDFLAAVFLVLSYKSSQQYQSCLPIYEILNMRVLYIFACGMDSNVLTLLLQQIRNSFWENNRILNKQNSHFLEQIQDLICECLRARGNKTKSQLSCHTESISIVSKWKNSDWRWGYLNQLINEHPNSIKILHVYIYTENPSDEFRKCLKHVLSKCQSIRHVRLVLWENPSEDIKEELGKAFCSSWSSPSLDVFGEVPNALIPYIIDDRDDQHRLMRDQLQRKGKLFPKKATLTDLLHKKYNDKSVTSIISSHIQSLSKTIQHVFACYKPDDENTVVFLIMHDEEIESDVQEKLKKFNIFYRKTNHVNSEKREVFFRKVFNEEMFTKEEDENIRKCIAENSDEYFNKHSNITMILPNNVKSVGYGGNHKLLNKPCIVLFVPVKGLIPVGEEKISATFGGYTTDVMEGTLSFFVRTAKERHKNIKLGCQIMSEIGKKGTVGPMIKLHDNNFAFITAGHVVYRYYDSLSSFLKTKIYQPDSDDASNLIGEVETLIVDDEMEIAIIRIKDRWPRERGIFPECSSYVKENGFCSSNSFYSGKWCETDEGIEVGTKVYMFGSQSGATKGYVLSKTHPAKIDFALKLKNQLAIADISSRAAFSQPGDSGSAVFVKTSDGSFKIVGILTSGGQGFYVVTPIWKIGKRIAEENYTPLQFKPNENLQTVKDDVERLKEEIKRIKSRPTPNEICYLRTNKADDVEMGEPNN